MLALAGMCIPASAQQYRIRGYVRDAKTGETLIGAGIQAGSTVGVTNEYGYYALHVSSGAQSLRASYVGYEPLEKTLEIRCDSILHFDLKPSETLSAAVVTTENQTGIHTPTMGVIDIPSAFVHNTPTPLGEPDLLKTAQLFPGIQSGTEGTAGLYIRGGNTDETMYLMDGIPLYNVSHMLGLFSAFSPDAVKKASIFKSTFPARYGGRVSGIVDAKMNDGDQYRTNGSASLGMLSSRGHIEGPIVPGKLSYSLSARGLHTLYLDPIIRKSDVKFNYWYYDLCGKLTWNASSDNRLFLSFYLGDDWYHSEPKPSGYAQQSTQMSWGNALAALRWSHVFSNALFTEMQLSYSRFRSTSQSHLTYKEQDDIFYDNELNSGIRDFSLQYNADWVLSSAHHINGGIQTVLHLYSPGTHFTGTDYFRGERFDFNSHQSGTYSGLESAVYFEDRIHVFSWLQMDLGLRGCLTVAGERTYFSPEPRLSARVRLGRGFAVKLSGGMNSQFVHLLTSSHLSMPSDIWVPVTSNVPPVLTRQYSIGGYHTGLPGWEFSMEGYLKLSENVVEYKDGVSYFSADASWESMISFGRGRAFGMELLARKSSGQLTGWLAYSLAKSERYFPDGTVSGGEWFPIKYDRRHIVTLCTNYRFNDKLDLSATWSFESGYMTTLTEGATLIPSTVYPGEISSNQLASHISRRNNYRLPPSHRLNVSLNLHSQYRHGAGLWQFGIYNLYNALNPNLVYLRDVYPDGTQAPVKESKLIKITFLPILPSVSYTYYFGNK